MNLNDKAIKYISGRNGTKGRVKKNDTSPYRPDVRRYGDVSFSPIAECFESKDKYFCGVATTDGTGSPRNGLYANYTDEDMKKIRITEQKKAATVGEYTAQILLGYSSNEVKDKNNDQVIHADKAYRPKKSDFISNYYNRDELQTLFQSVKGKKIEFAF